MGQQPTTLVTDVQDAFDLAYGEDQVRKSRLQESGRRLQESGRAKLEKVTPDQMQEALTTVVAQAGEDFNYRTHYGKDTEILTKNLPDDEGYMAYPACLYVEANPVTGSPEPGCVAGRAFAKLGLTLDELKAFEGMPADIVVGFSSDVRRWNNVPAQMAWEAQKIQDAPPGNKIDQSWGGVLRKAVRTREAMERGSTIPGPEEH